MSIGIRQYVRRKNALARLEVLPMRKGGNITRTSCAREPEPYARYVANKADERAMLVHRIRLFENMHPSLVVSQ